MKVFLDTSTLVAAIVEGHESHAQAYAIMDRVQTGLDEGFVSVHGIAEVYAVLTKSPPPFRHSPEQAVLSLEENIIKHFKIIALSAADYILLIREAAVARVQGGSVYDTILISCAVKADVDKVFTLNLRHFRALAPKSLASKIFAS
jgi:predicted nucleic acid-binding protein